MSRRGPAARASTASATAATCSPDRPAPNITHACELLVSASNRSRLNRCNSRSGLLQVCGHCMAQTAPPGRSIAFGLYFQSGYAPQPCISVWVLASSEAARPSGCRSCPPTVRVSLPSPRPAELLPCCPRRQWPRADGARGRLRAPEATDFEARQSGIRSPHCGLRQSRLRSGLGGTHAHDPYAMQKHIFPSSGPAIHSAEPRTGSV